MFQGDRGRHTTNMASDLLLATSPEGGGVLSDRRNHQKTRHLLREKSRRLLHPSTWALPSVPQDAVSLLEIQTHFVPQN